MRNPKITLMLLALVGLIGVAGCGGGDDSSSTTSSSTATESSTATDSTATDSSTSVDAAAYSDQLTAVLSDSLQSLQALTTISSAGSPQEFSSQIDDAEVQIQQTIDDLSALTPPAGAEDAQQQLIDAYTNFKEKLAAVGDAVSSGDKAATQQAAAALKQAGKDFQQQLLEAGQKLEQAGVTIGAASGG